LGGLFLAPAIASCFVLIYFWEEIQQFGNYGYPFVLLVGIYAAFGLANPAPYVLVVFTMGTILNPALVAVISGLGAATGITIVYLLGRGGRRLFSGVSLFSSNPNGTIARWTSRIMNWAQRRGPVAVFALSVVLVPAYFAPVAIAMGVSRSSIWKLFLISWGGNVVKGLFLAYCGYFGLGALLR
jgi:membrane protein DedA with SNARE-associated domain